MSKRRRKPVALLLDPAFEYVSTKDDTPERFADRMRRRVAATQAKPVNVALLPQRRTA
jgi:hypothetical protein